MPSGLYRGVVKRIDEAGYLYINLQRFGGNSLFGPCEPIPEVTFFTGENVLCEFLEGHAVQVEIIRKAFTPGTYLSTYEENY